MLKRLSLYIKEYKKVSLLSMFFAFLEVIMELLIPYETANLIDKGITPGSFANVIKYGLLMALFSVFALVLGIADGKFAAAAATGFAKNLRSAMYKNIQNFSFKNIDKYSTAGLVTRLTTDVTNVQMAYMMIIRVLIRAPFTTIIAIIMSVIISHRLSSIYLISLIFLIIALSTIVFFATSAFSRVFKKYENLNASVQENIRGIRVVKSFVRESHEKEKFSSAANFIYKLFIKAESIVVFNFPVMMITVYGTLLALSWFGAKYIVAGKLTTGQLTSMLSYAMNIFMGLMFLTMVFVMITMSVASARRIDEVISEVSFISEKKDALRELKDGSISFENVSFSYGEKEEPQDFEDSVGFSAFKRNKKKISKNKEAVPYVLSDISFEIKSGETVGILGGTGSGKSTLVSLISRMYDTSCGKVSVGGTDVRDLGIKELRNGVSMVLQQNELFSGTILDNLRWGDENASLNDCIKACKISCADEFINEFPDKYETEIEQGGVNISGGQKQRICIARALLKKPKILILDDSTSAVDTATEKKISSAMKDIIPETTKIIISQRISAIKDADKIIVLDGGRLSGIGTNEELMKNNEIYRTTAESQQTHGDFDMEVEN